jgi:hypothetical protein
MSAPHPHSLADLALAPVLLEIERNLKWLRDSDDLEFNLALDLNDDASWYKTAAERADRIARCVTRTVELHGWQVQPAADLYGLVVRHGGYDVSLMFGRQLTSYIDP